MWARLIKVRVRPGTDLSVGADLLKTFEQAGSGLVRELFMQDQNDPSQAYVLALFESEEKRVSASRIRVAKRGSRPCAMVADVLAGPPVAT